MKQMAKDKVMNELTIATGKNALPATRKPRTEKNNQSIDLNPIGGKKKSLPGALMARDNSKAELNRHPLQIKPLQEPPSQQPRPQLNVTLKLEVAKLPSDLRASALDVAYTLEELLVAVENGLT